MRVRISYKDAQATCFRVQIQMLHLDIILYFMSESESYRRDQIGLPSPGDITDDDYDNIY